MDFAFYTGLQRKSNIFETKAQNRQMELQIMQTMDQRSEMKLKQEAEVDAKMQEYFNTINQLDVLEQDKDRISATEKTLRLDVLQKVKQYNGNLQNFMYGGGAATLQAYQNNLMESDAVEGAIANKTNKAQWDHAQANGLFVKDVGVDVDVMDPETGEMKKERRIVSMDEAFGLFEKGAIDRLPYDGAEKDIDVGPEFFQKLFKDPRNPYSQDTNVTKQDVYNWVFEHGGSDQQARKKADQYQLMLDQGATEWRYKSGDFMKKRLVEAQIQGQYLRNKGLKKSLEAQEKPPNLIMNTTQRINNLQPGQSANIFPEELDFLTGQTGLGLVYDEKTGGYTAGAKGGTASDWYIKGQNESPAEYDLSMFSSLIPLSYVKDPRTGAPMMKFQASYASEGAWSYDEPMREDFFGFDQYNEGAHANNWKKTEDNWGNDVYQGEVLVPIGDYMDRWSQTYMNKQTNLRSNAWMVPQSGMTTSQGQLMYDMDQRISKGAQYLMDQYGYGYDQAVGMIMEGANNTFQDDGQGSGGMMREIHEQGGF